MALSLGFRRVAVSHHRALSCPDFPPRTYFNQSIKIRLQRDTELYSNNPQNPKLNKVGAGRPPDPPDKKTQDLSLKIEDFLFDNVGII